MTEGKNVKIREGVLIALIAVLVVIVGLLAFILYSLVNGDDQDNGSKNQSITSSDVAEDNSKVQSDDKTSSEDDTSSKGDTQSKDDNSYKEENPQKPEIIETPTGVKLDANFGRLLLINGEHALPDDYDTKVREYLVEIDDEYRNNDYVTQIHKDVYPYITAMVAAAQADGVNLQVWSPFRSYAIQNDLFRKQVDRVGGDEAKAATVVARPGTSEHNTGLCADFNMASDAFESTPMYEWMCENAEDYGFILRYPKDKQPITGVIYESWHWRFVGINNAKEINKLGVTLEEYIEMKDYDPTMDMYKDDSQN